MKKVVVLWTGGKDSCLALHLCKEMGYDVVALATFVPSNGSEFKAHPQSEIRRQAERLGLPIHFIEINEPYKKSYISSLLWIKETLGASAVVTGDIDLVGGLPNWIQDCCNGIELGVLRPLWMKPRDVIMREILLRGIQVKITWINHSSIPQSWLNRIIDSQLLEEMMALALSTGIDLAGENGEYHTMTVWTPAFKFE